MYLTDEDHAIFRRMPVAAQAALHKADRKDAHNLDTFGKANLSARLYAADRRYIASVGLTEEDRAAVWN